MGLAYLLARAADTITDTKLLPPEQRREYLISFRQQVHGPACPEPLRQIELALTGKQSIPAERELLESLLIAFAALESTAEPDRTLIRSVVVTLSQGMEYDLVTFPPEDSGWVAPLEDRAALDWYVYQVAGCVGEFWTAITMAHMPALQGLNRERMSELGVAFGKALQLTNVLRDVPKDLRMGRCYLPGTDLAQIGLSPEELLSPSKGPEARPVLVEWAKTALEHYASAEEYLYAIPRRCLRLRLAVLWPMLFGLATLARLARNDLWLDPAQPSRVNRMWVYRTMVLSAVGAYSNGILRTWIRGWRKKVEDALER